MSPLKMLFGTVVFVGLAGCTDPDQSLFVYRLPYENNTDVFVSNDHLSHNNQLDLVGVNGTGPYPIVAARAGTVRFIRDDETESCHPDDGCPNNYVWIEHEPGEEWTKYSHLATGTVRGAAGLSEGDAVVAGQYLGDEGNIGMVTGLTGIHVHFHVAVPTNINIPGPFGNVGNFSSQTFKIPRFCIPGGIVVEDETYTAEACPSD